MLISDPVALAIIGSIPATIASIGAIIVSVVNGRKIGTKIAELDNTVTKGGAETRSDIAALVKEEGIVTRANIAACCHHPASDVSVKGPPTWPEP